MRQQWQAQPIVVKVVYENKYSLFCKKVPNQDQKVGTLDNLLSLSSVYFLKYPTDSIPPHSRTITTYLNFNDTPFTCFEVKSSQRLITIRLAVYSVWNNNNKIPTALELLLLVFFLTYIFTNFSYILYTVHKYGKKVQVNTLCHSWLA